MKRIVALFLAIIAVFSLCACSTINGGSAEKAEWEEFIDDYNEWVDEYVAIVDKYKANPADTSILTDYTKMASEVADWAEKADKLTAELKDSPTEASKFAAELLKISNKLAKAAQ